MSDRPPLRPFALALAAVIATFVSAIAVAAWLERTGALCPEGRATRAIAAVVTLSGMSTPFVLIPLLLRLALRLGSSRPGDPSFAVLRTQERTLRWMIGSLCAAGVVFVMLLAGILWLAGPA